MKRKQPLTYEEFKAIYSKVPKLCVDLIIEHKSKVILILRQEHGWEGLWHTPGGTVHYKESLRNAVKRLAKEEINLSVEITKFFGYVEYLHEEKVRGFGSTVSLVFGCKLKSGQKLYESETIKYFNFIPKNIIKEHKVFLKKWTHID